MIGSCGHKIKRTHSGHCHACRIKAGACTNCGQFHTNISAVTGKHAVRCFACADLARQAKRRWALKQNDYHLDACACGKTKRSSRTQCYRCQERSVRALVVNVAPKSIKPFVPQRHVPTSVYLQSNPIDAKYRFAAVLR